MSPGPANDLVALLEPWTAGWALAKGCPPPQPGHGGFRTEVGWPDQVRRYVFPAIGPGLIALGQTITQPFVMLKALSTVEALAAVLPPRWSFEPQAWFMADDGFSAPERAPPPGYHLAWEAAGAARRLIVRDAAGVEAGQGRLVVVGDAAIYDRIVVGPDHGRRGLGSTIMGALGREAQNLGARRGLLNATAAGRELYTALGWRLVSPYATAVIRPHD